MSIINLQQLNQKIKGKLFEIAYKIECFNKSGDYDINRYAETYFKEILNIIFKEKTWRFDKATKINQDTYDLYDKKKKVCIQITSNKRQIKKDDTIRLFNKNNHNNDFETLIILFISNTKPKKNKYENLNFNYQDFNIIEFSGLIENNCNQKSLLEIRDILFNNLIIPKENKNPTKTSNKISKREFLRCLKLQKDLTKELLHSEYWEFYSKEELRIDPTLKFKDSRFILRAIDDETYPYSNENSKWSRTFMSDFYDKGILIWLDRWFGNKVVINENNEWCLKDKYEKSNTKNKVKEVSVRIIGKLPYRNIVHYDDGDNIYNDYHLYCEYKGIDNSPFEEIIYMCEDINGDYSFQLDNSKKIEI